MKNVLHFSSLHSLFGCSSYKAIKMDADHRRYCQLKRTIAMMQCQYCMVFVRIKYYERHCLFAHSLDIRRECIFCEKLWDNGMKDYHHLRLCFTNVLHASPVLKRVFFYWKFIHLKLITEKGKTFHEVWIFCYKLQHCLDENFKFACLTPCVRTYSRLLLTAVYSLLNSPWFRSTCQKKLLCFLDCVLKVLLKLCGDFSEIWWFVSVRHFGV